MASPLATRHCSTVRPSAVNNGTQVGGIVVQRLPHHPAHFPVGVGARTHKLKVGRHGEITIEVFEEVLKFVALEPDVITRPGHGIRIGSFIEARRPGQFRIADVGTFLKLTDFFGRRKRDQQA